MKTNTFKFILILFILAGCVKDALFDSGKIIVHENYFEENIVAIEINTILEITLIQDTINKARIICGENLHPNIDFYTQNGILYLNNSIKYNWSRKYNKIKVELHLISIPQINIHSPIYLTTQGTFKSNEFAVVNSSDFSELNVTIEVNKCSLDVSYRNFGQYTLKGKATNATFVACGSSFIYANDLIVDKCLVQQNSIGDIYTNVTNEFFVSIEKAGKVYYYGEPSTIVKINNFSSNKLVHLIK